MKSERLQISLYARDLKNVAGVFKGTSDPFAVVTLLGSASNPNGMPEDMGKVLGKTEVYVHSDGVCNKDSFVSNCCCFLYSMQHQEYTQSYLDKDNSCHIQPWKTYVSECWNMG